MDEDNIDDFFSEGEPEYSYTDMDDDNIDDFFEEEKPEYTCELCDEPAVYRFKCGAFIGTECSYVCEEDLDDATCPECNIERIYQGD